MFYLSYPNISNLKMNGIVNSSLMVLTINSTSQVNVYKISYNMFNNALYD